MSDTPRFDAKAFLATLTNQSGVYRMYDSNGEVIYVGKAKHLKKRVGSYFRKQLDTIKTQTLVSHIAHMDVTVTHSETEALILESHYIKKYKPRYNVLLRDDKSYPYILVTEHTHPRLTVHRGARKVKGEYFGPYPSAGAVRESLRVMQKLFPVRQCEDAYYRSRSRPCLQYQLKRCAGPCVEGLVSDDEYQQQVELAKLFLKGKNTQVMDTLVKRMEDASGRLDFERAAIYRDQITAMSKVQAQQHVSGNTPEMDIFGLSHQAGTAAIYGLFVRDNKILGSKSFYPKLPGKASEEEVLRAFILQYYLNQQRPIPKQIVLPIKLEEQDDLAAAFSQQAGYKVQLYSGARGEKRRYLALASTNAETARLSKQSQHQSISKRIDALEQALELSLPLKRMECFDISHTSGQQTVASCVVFNRDGPQKSDYRRFNIEGITPGDDYAAMDQVLRRRFKPDCDKANIPDILFIDGGKGQLAQAEAFFDEFPGAVKPMLVGVAKGTSRKPGLETLILAGSHATLPLPGDSPALHLVQHIRDESHRFAISGHRARRQKAKRTSGLEDIPGVGPKKRQSLLKYLGGLQEVKKASIEELAKVPGISLELADTIYQHLH